MFNRPNEKDQINRIIKNLLSTYSSKFVELGSRMPSIMGNWRKARASLQLRGHMGEERPLLKLPIL